MSMKIWSRDFTRFEKTLLLILSVILIGLVYFQFVEKPVRRAIASSKAESRDLETELTAVKARAERLDKLDSEIDAIKGSGSVSRMESYNNSSREVDLLNDILSDTLKYTITFADVTRTNDQIRRNFTLEFRTADYYSMRKIIERICGSPYRCLVDEISCTTTRNDKESYVTAKLTATFYETMVGGTPDAGLPVDSAASQNEAEVDVSGLR